MSKGKGKLKRAHNQNNENNEHLNRNRKKTRVKNNQGNNNSNSNSNSNSSSNNNISNSNSNSSNNNNNSNSSNRNNKYNDEKNKIISLSLKLYEFLHKIVELENNFSNNKFSKESFIKMLYYKYYKLFNTLFLEKYNSNIINIFFNIIINIIYKNHILPNTFQNDSQIIINIKKYISLKILKLLIFDLKYENTLVIEDDTYVINFYNWSNKKLKDLDYSDSDIFDYNLNNNNNFVIGIIYKKSKDIINLANSKKSEYVGYISGLYNFYDNLEHNVKIKMVTIFDKYKGKGLCNFLIINFINYIENNISRIIEKQPDEIKLFNAGGYISCYCYIKAFIQMGYIAKSHNHNITKKICNNNRQERQNLATKKGKRIENITKNNLKNANGKFDYFGKAGINMTFIKQN